MALYCLIPLALLFFTGCASRPCDTNESLVSTCVEAQISAKVQWNRQVCEETIDFLLQNEALSCHHAIQIALLNNPKIQVFFENIGIAEAELKQAGLWRNPFFDLAVRFPNDPAFKTNIPFNLSFYMLDVFLIPLKKKVATAELSRVEAEATQMILDIAFEVEATYYSLLTAYLQKDVQKGIVELLEAAWEIGQAQAIAGTLNGLELEKLKTRYLTEMLVLTQVDVERVRLQEHLQQLLGFPEEICWTLPSCFPCPYPLDYTLCQLEELSLQKRMDLQAARWQVEKFVRAKKTKAFWTYLDWTRGYSGEREPEGVFVMGPSMGGSLPLFDYGQAQRAKLFSAFWKSVEEVKVKEIQILSEVRSAYHRYELLEQLVNEYQMSMLPLQTQLLDKAQSYFNVMGLGTYQLIDQKIAQYANELSYLLALRDYWLTRVDLARAIGGWGC